jgi:hypothetical protein
MYIKDWFKPIFTPCFNLTPNTYGRFCPHPPIPIVIGQVMAMDAGKKAFTYPWQSVKCRHKWQVVRSQYSHNYSHKEGCLYTDNNRCMEGSYTHKTWAFPMVNHSPPPTAEVKKEWSYRSNPDISLQGGDRDNFMFHLRKSL